MAQEAPAPVSKVQSIVNAIDDFNERMPVEKIFVHIDKPYYSNADTIWLKAYVLNDKFALSPQSAIVYAELVNDTGMVVQQQAIPVVAGVGISQMALDPEEILEGSYTLRAYTNWMQNLGNESFFSRRIFISNADEGNWIVKSDSKTTMNKNGKPVIDMAMQITDQSGTPIRLREMQLRLTQGSRTYIRQKMQTDIDGRLSFNFEKPGSADNNRLRIIAQDLRKGAGGKQLDIPVNLQPGSNPDVQFMPESGQLVNGITSTVGFKAIGEDGKGFDIQGTVISSKGTVVASFTSGYKGIGSFALTPVSGETYTAKVNLPGGEIKNFALPTVKNEGLVLRVSVLHNSSAIIVAGSGKFVNQKYSLVCLSGTNVCYAAQMELKPEGVTGRLPVDKFPQGIIRYVLFNGNNQPVAERMVYIDHHQKLNINATGDKTTYHGADSVNLSINVTDNNNSPVSGTFSLAVTNDAQVKADSADVATIDNYMLLTGNLKGYVEDPGHYFSDTSQVSNQELDNLLLTQGWVGYDWDMILSNPKPPKFIPEPELGISGTISKSGKPQPNVRILLMAQKKAFIIRDTVTDVNGRFHFKNLPLFDTVTYRVEAKDKKGKPYPYDIKMDEFSQADTKELSPSVLTPWYVNSDNTMLNYNKQNIAQRKAANILRFGGDGIVLKQVNISGKKVVPGSKNLNGAGVADQVLDDNDLKGAGKTSVLSMLEKKVKGFTPFKLMGRPVKFVVDGINLDFFNDRNPHVPRDPNRDSTLEVYKFLFDSLNEMDAQNVKGIETMYNNRNMFRYMSHYDPQLLKQPPLTWPAYIEITTYSGNGIFTRKTYGVSIFQPLALSISRSFYIPKYTVANAGAVGQRTTIYWNPFIVTDKEGKASVSFVNGVKPGSYTYIIQGANIDGQIGSTRGKLVVK